jgi:serine/threonine protein kinase
MKQVCLLCERVSDDLNLWCQETYCPAEASPFILDYGEWLGDIEIVKTVSVMRSAVIYEANHQESRVYLKVAHAGENHRERLKREAEFLQTVQGNDTYAAYFPALLPAYAFSSVESDPYGKAMLKGSLLYFYLFEFVEGESLRDLLEKNPQLWVNHVGWITVSLSAALHYLNQRGVYHFALSPEAVLVRFDDKPNVPRVLLADLGIVSDAQNANIFWDPAFVPPAYTAPELLDGATGAGPATEVYGLGVLLYELLVGEPAYSYKLRSEADIYRAVRRDRRAPMTRLEDVRRVAELAVTATSASPSNRWQTPGEMYAGLVALFGEVPDPERGWWPSNQTLLVLIAAVLAIAFLILIALSFAPAA